ncbi:hypothetical protein [Jiella pacifica]|uniref:Uncharacterized protein n=1 Tax=Jiella pacifica TaxID=2696469 RepID=A0A6N9TBI3_9HYPH|nr:hypothetical protein [Jiella pacifica]NDW07932.1 hypothetical protein [Jiella pacifica]
MKIQEAWDKRLLGRAPAIKELKACNDDLQADVEVIRANSAAYQAANRKPYAVYGLSTMHRYLQIDEDS